MAILTGGTAPYAPPSAVIEVIERYRERGIQTPITTEVLERIGVPESLSNRTMQALRLLDFVGGDGAPTEELVRLGRAPADEYKSGLQNLLVNVYAEVYSFADPATDGIDRIRDAFRAYNPRGQQERMVTLFLGLCEWAGIDISAAINSKKKPEAKAAGGNGARRQPEAKPGRRPDKPTGASKKKQKVQQAGAGGDGNLNAEGLPPGLVGLLHQIPRDGAGWTAERRDTFMAAFKAVLDFSVPVRATEPAPPSDREDEEKDDS
ncbi:MAG: DUF5343 domain-containing protein [Actinobacteria bacterium]|nr:DUF5343 domain-containing protein [Actinomycetota bacterium]